MERILFMLLLLPSLGMGQTMQNKNKYRGIIWTEGLSWQQIKEKAKAENKYIFIDCYATWCVPCKRMDNSVYPESDVGSFVNSRFIALRLQMDTSFNDSKEVQAWYQEARKFKSDYHINAMPTFLFFSPDGEPLDKEVGGRDKDGFIEMLKSTFEPDKQWYTLLSLFENGILPPEKVPVLVKLAKRIGEDSYALEIARSYMHNYLDKLNVVTLLQKKHLNFLLENAKMIKASDKIFKTYIQNERKIDSIEEKDGYAKSRIKYILLQNEVYPILTHCLNVDKKPNWRKLSRRLRKYYDRDMAETCILTARVNWFRLKKDGPLYASSLVNQITRFGYSKEPPVNLNNSAWEVFKYSSRKKELRIALQWINYAIPLEKTFKFTYMDTKANILYKLGETNKAIEVLEEIIKGAKNDKQLVTSAKEKAQKMQTGENTWPNTWEPNY